MFLDCLLGLLNGASDLVNVNRTATTQSNYEISPRTLTTQHISHWARTKTFTINSELFETIRHTHYTYMCDQMIFLTIRTTVVISNQCCWHFFTMFLLTMINIDRFRHIYQWTTFIDYQSFLLVLLIVDLLIRME